MIVVSDTSSISALLRIDQCGLLAQIYGKVIIPKAVEAELLRRFDPLPGFLQCFQASNPSAVRQLCQELDLGEAEAIVLARELGADILLMGEANGRAVAMREHIPLIGLIGVLLLAKRQGLIQSVDQTIRQLETEANFRLSSDIKQTALKSAGEL